MQEISLDGYTVDTRGPDTLLLNLETQRFGFTDLENDFGPDDKVNPLDLHLILTSCMGSDKWSMSRLLKSPKLKDLNERAAEVQSSMFSKFLDALENMPSAMWDLEEESAFSLLLLEEVYGLTEEQALDAQCRIYAVREHSQSLREEEKLTPEIM